MVDLKLVKPDQGWSKSALAAEFGLARQTVEKIVRPIPHFDKNAGHPVWRMRDVAPAFVDYMRGQEGARTHDPDSMGPKERNDWFQSEQRRLTFEKESGLLLTTEEFSDALTRCFGLIKNFFGSVPDVLELRAALTPEQTELVIELCDKLTNELHIEMIGDDDVTESDAED